MQLTNRTGKNPSHDILEADRVSRFIHSYVSSSKAKGTAVGISGGVDSALVATLAVRALGPKKVTGLFMFEDMARAGRDFKDAKSLVSKLKIRSSEFNISPLIKAFSDSFSEKGGSTTPISKLALANIKARVRMTLLYAVANEENLLVLGTGDKSEEMLGYFTKYGDGGADILPIAHLYKTEVRSLARALGIPSCIADKPSSPNLWESQLASDELPAEYQVLDKVLGLVYEKGIKSEAKVSRLSGATKETIRKVKKMHENSRHKRNYPPSMAGTEK